MGRQGGESESFSKAGQDDERMLKLEEELKDLRQRCEDSDNMYDEVQKKVNQTEADLEKADIRVEVGEFKIIEMEEELRVVANNLKSLEVSEEKSNAREASDKTTVKSLSTKLKQAEARAEFAEKSVQKLQKEVDRLENDLVDEQEKLKNITEEVESTFVELSGY